jgi:hypothetical protein
MQGLKQLEEEGIFTETSNVVVIFPDHGSRYMSKIFSDTWMSQQGFFDAETVHSDSIEHIK